MGKLGYLASAPVSLLRFVGVHLGGESEHFRFLLPPRNGSPMARWAALRLKRTASALMNRSLILLVHNTVFPTLPHMLQPTVGRTLQCLSLLQHNKGGRIKLRRD